MTDTTVDPVAEVVELCRELIRIDTSNYGDEDGPGERKAAEYVATLLDEVGIESRPYESEPGRTSVAAQWGRGGAGPRATGCCSTATWTSYRRLRRTGRSTRSPGRSGTGTSGVAVRST